MSNLNSLITPSTQTVVTPRARRGAAAVFAQYIQDLTHPTASSAAAA